MTVNQKFATGEIVRLDQPCRQCSSRLFAVCLDGEALCCKCSVVQMKPNYDGAEFAAYDHIRNLLAEQSRQLVRQAEIIKTEVGRDDLGQLTLFTTRTKQLVEMAQRMRLMADALYSRRAEQSL